MSELNLEKKCCWKYIEAKGISHYVEKGYNVLVKLVDNSGYDFVIEKNGDFRRINVKVAFINDKNKPNSWAISAPSNPNWRRKKYSDVLDTYLVWLPHQEKFIEIEGTFLDNFNSKHRKIGRFIK